MQFSFVFLEHQYLTCYNRLASDIFYKYGQHFNQDCVSVYQNPWPIFYCIKYAEKFDKKVSCTFLL